MQGVAIDSQPRGCFGLDPHARFEDLQNQFPFDERNDSGVQIVRGTELLLSSTPYPSWSGSSRIPASTLSRIGSTTVYQQASLIATLVHTDESRVPVTIYQGVEFTGSTVSNSNTFELRQASSKTIYTPSEPGFVTIEASMHGVVSTVLSLTVLDAAVSIAGIHSVDIQGSGATHNTVSGLKGAHFETVFGIAFFFHHQTT